MKRTLLTLIGFFLAILGTGCGVNKHALKPEPTPQAPVVSNRSTLTDLTPRPAVKDARLSARPKAVRHHIPAKPKATAQAPVSAPAPSAPTQAVASTDPKPSSSS